jgi:hypothetical protein
MVWGSSSIEVAVSMPEKSGENDRNYRRFWRGIPKNDNWRAMGGMKSRVFCLLHLYNRVVNLQWKFTTQL